MPDNLPTDRDLAAERHWSMSRRKFLRGVGACVALPTLPSLWPRSLQAAEVAPSTAAAGMPRRFAFVTIPNGVNLDAWWPKGEGEKFELAPTMSPLAALK